MEQKKKRNLYIMLLGIIIIGIGIAAGVFLYYFLVMKNTLQEITTPETSKTVLSVYVAAEDPAESIEDTQDYTFGFCRMEPDEAPLNQILLKLEDVFDEFPKTAEYEDMFQLADSINTGPTRATIINEAYLPSLIETAGYEWIETGLRKIDSLSYERPVESESDLPDQLPKSFIVYISGIDTYGGISVRSRSDVNILAAVNTETQQIFLAATPRDFYVQSSATKGQKDKLTHMGIYGVGASIDALEQLYNIKIDYYLRINFTGFVELIDALGGIEVYSDYAFSVKDIKDYQKGYNQVNGLEALAFARERYSFANGDYQRAKNQMEVIRAIIKKCASPAILRNYRSIMEAISGAAETNMPEDQIEALAVKQLLMGWSWEISTYTAEGDSAYLPTYSIPGRNLYVILPDEESLQYARLNIQETIS